MTGFSSGSGPKPPNGPEPAQPPGPSEIPPPGRPPPAPSPDPPPGEVPVHTPPETPPPPVPDEVPPGSHRRGGALSRTLFLGAVLLWAGMIAAPAAEQVPGDDPAADSDDPCRVEPAEPGEDGTAGSGEDARSRPALEDCNGVLVPPPTGDEEIEEPPPETGTTPVIPPGRVPETPPDPETLPE